MTHQASNGKAGRPGGRRALILLLALMVLATGVRLGVGLARVDQLYWLGDSKAYREIADNLVDGRGLVMADPRGGGRLRYAERMPGYPLALAALRWAFGRSDAAVVVAQSLLGALSVALAWLLGREVAGKTAGLVAAGLVALSPWQVYFATVALTECWSTPLLLATILCTMRAAERPGWVWAVGAGLFCAALGYVHPEFLALPLLIGLLAAIARGRRRHLARWAVAAAVVALALSPWWIRNRVVLGGNVPATTRGGVTLYDGVGPQATGRSDMRFEQQRASETQPLDELAYDAYYRRASLRLICSEPGRIAGLAPRKLSRLWSPTPNLAAGQRPLYRWASRLAYVPMVAGAMLGLIVLLRRPGRLAILLAPVVMVTLVHALLVGSVRYRVPIEPMLFVMAGAAVAWVQRGPKVTGGCGAAGG